MTIQDKSGKLMVGELSFSLLHTRTGGSRNHILG